MNRVAVVIEFPTSLLRQALYQRIPRIAVVKERDLGQYVVGQVVKLFAGADGHKNMGRAVFNEANNSAGYFSKRHALLRPACGCHSFSNP